MIRRVWLALALPLLLAPCVTAQVKGPVTFSTDVLPGKWKAVRLRNLPKDAVIACRVQTSGEVMMSFLDADDFGRFPAAARPLFSGRVEKQLAFSLRIPAAGHYYVVFDNRSGKEPRSVTLTIRAARGRQKDGTKNEPTALRPRLAPESPTAYRPGPAPHEADLLVRVHAADGVSPGTSPLSAGI
jgi:hypothetical protein